MTPDCQSATVIDLREQFGDRYHIVVDPAKQSRNRDPMYWIIPCKFGEIYPYGGEHLAVMVTSIRIANEMREWPELRVHQDADDAVVFVFHVDHFQTVSDRVRARKKKRLSPEHLAKLQKAGTAALQNRVLQAVQGPKSRQNGRSEVKA